MTMKNAWLRFCRKQTSKKNKKQKKTQLNLAMKPVGAYASAQFAQPFFKK